MTDHFEKAMADIAINSAANGGPTIQDVLTALVAKNEDDDDRAEVLRKEAREAKGIAADLARAAVKEGATLAAMNDEDHKHIISILDVHLVQADSRDVRIAKLEAYKEDSERTCEGRVKKLISEEHKLVHDQHMNELHPMAAQQKGLSPLGRDYADPSDAQFTEHRESAFPEDRNLWEMLLGYSVLKRVIWLVVGALIVFGLSYGADSCSRSHYWGPEAPAIVASPQATEAP